jgi:hypothetical protein
LAGIFAHRARRVLIGACLVVFVIWMTGVLGHVTEVHMGLYLGPDRPELLALCLSILLIPTFAVFLRTNCCIRPWELFASLVLVELFVAAAILDANGQGQRHAALLEVLKFNCANHVDQVLADWNRQVLEYHFLKQRWYIAAPWLLGIFVGEIILRRRKPGGGQRQEI